LGKQILLCGCKNKLCQKCLTSARHLNTKCCIQGVSGGIVNILGGGSADYS